MTTYPWPEGKAAALCVTFDLDGEAPHLWRTRERPPVGLAELEQRRFGPRRGVHRVLEMLRRLQISSTFFVPGWIAQQYPHLVRAVHEDGHEVALHGWLHEPPTDLAAKQLEGTLARASDEIERLTGQRPVGYRSPSWQMSDATFEVLRKLELRYDSSLMGDDRPYTVESLTEVPVDWATDDAPYLRYVAGDPRPPGFASDLAGAWAHEILAARRHGTLCMLTMHPFLSGRAARVVAVEQILADADTENLAIGRVDALAAHHRSRVMHADDAGVRLAWPDLENST